MKITHTEVMLITYHSTQSKITVSCFTIAFPVLPRPWLTVSCAGCSRKSQATEGQGQVIKIHMVIYIFSVSKVKACQAALSLVFVNLSLQWKLLGI